MLTIPNVQFMIVRCGRTWTKRDVIQSLGSFQKVFAVHTKNHISKSMAQFMHSMLEKYPADSILRSDLIKYMYKMFLFTGKGKKRVCVLLWACGHLASFTENKHLTLEVTTVNLKRGIPAIEYCTSIMWGGLVRDRLKKRLVKFGAVEAMIVSRMGQVPKTPYNSHNATQ